MKSKICITCQKEFTHLNNLVKSCDDCWNKSFLEMEHRADTAKYTCLEMEVVTVKLLAASPQQKATLQQLTKELKKILYDAEVQHEIKEEKVYVPVEKI